MPRLPFSCFKLLHYSKWSEYPAKIDIQKNPTLVHVYQHILAVIGHFSLFSSLSSTEETFRHRNEFSEDEVPMVRTLD